MEIGQYCPRSREFVAFGHPKFPVPCRTSVVDVLRSTQPTATHDNHLADALRTSVPFTFCIYLLLFVKLQHPALAGINTSPVSSPFFMCAFKRVSRGMPCALSPMRSPLVAGRWARSRARSQNPFQVAIFSLPLGLSPAPFPTMPSLSISQSEPSRCEAESWLSLP